MQQPVPRVSVCLPASRPTDWFKGALRSVLSQEMPDLEVVITDDSGGDLEAAVEHLADARVQYYRNAVRLGFAGNHSRAIDLARGEAVAFIHDDDEWRPAYLRRVLGILDAHPDVGLVIADAEAVDVSGRAMGLRPPRMNAGLQSDPLACFLRRDFVAAIPSASVFRREALVSNRRPWPDVPAGDLTMYLDCVLAGWRVFHLSERLVDYRVHRAQLSDDAVSMRSAVINILEDRQFPRPDHELHRRRRLASEHVSRAAARLLLGDATAARADLRSARRWSPTTRWTWSTTIYVASYLPPLTFRKLERGLRSVRAAVRVTLMRLRRPDP